MNADEKIFLTPDFLRKIDGLLEDYNAGNEYALDRIVAEYEEKYEVQISSPAMLKVLETEGFI